MFKIEYYVKQVYGVEHFYILNYEIAVSVYGLTGRKTLTRSDMRHLTAMGFTFELVHKPQGV